jgi:hypothetical protein
VFQFQGRALTGASSFVSGARRLTASFDESFHNCTLDVIYGKEAGMRGTVERGHTTRLLLIKDSGQNCMINGRQYVWRQQRIQPVRRWPGLVSHDLPHATLAEWPYGMMRLACDYRPRRGQ